LKFSTQAPPAGFAPPSHRPPRQRPEQQWSFLLHAIQFGLQRQEPDAQYFVQQSLFFLQRLALAEPSPQGPSGRGPSMRALPSLLGRAAAGSAATSAARTPARPARRVTAEPRRRLRASKARSSMQDRLRTWLV
jgi:hypothetical protein